MAAEQFPVQTNLTINENVPSLSRRRSAPSEPDPLADILAKLGLGDGGNGTIISKQDEEGVILVMMDVLQIPADQAKFFLESANNDVAVAVDLHFELIGEANSGKRVRHDPSAFSDFMSSVPSGASVKHRWQNRDVHILGLTPGWQASVSSITGQIMFRHLESGISQSEVPPGFADAADDVRVRSPTDTTVMNNDDDDDVPDLVTVAPLPAKAPWASPKPPPLGGSFDFTPRNNNFKFSPSPPVKGAPFSFSSSETNKPISHSPESATPVSVALCDKGTGSTIEVSTEAMGEDEL